MSDFSDNDTTHTSLLDSIMSTIPQSCRQPKPSQSHSNQSTQALSCGSTAAISGSSVASSSRHASPIMTPDTAVLTTSSSVQASPEPMPALDEDPCPPNFQLPESIITRETSLNSLGQSIVSSTSVIPETPGISTSVPSGNTKTSLIRRISSRASKRITSSRRRQSSAAPHSRDASVGPCLLRRRSDSNTTAPPDFPTAAMDSESDGDEKEEFPTLKIALGQDAAGKSFTPTCNIPSAASSSTTMAGPVIPLGLQRGTWVTKVSKKSRPKRVCLVYDPDSSRLMWDKKRPNKFVHLDEILAVRSGTDVQQYGLDLNMSSISNLFTVIYSVPKKSENKIMHLVTENSEMCNVWTAFLDAMLKHRQELMISLMAFDDKAIAQYWQSEMSRQSGDQLRSGGEEELDIAAVKRVCQKLHIHSSPLMVERNFYLSDLRQCGRLNFAEFLTFVRRINQRPDIQQIIRGIAKQPELGITQDEFLQFVRNVQGEDVDANRSAWEKKFTLLSRRPKSEVNGKIESDQPDLQRMSETAFVSFLTSKQNGPLLEEPQMYTLDRPMNEYFISSSHNTYLLGRQVKGQSSVEGYIAALVQGCRCVEVDCWDGPDGQPQVVHGRTLTTAISFKEVMTTISKYAFVKTLFPLWISLEVHCSPPQQAIMAETMKEAFGSRLVTEPLDPDSDKLPSPSQLMERILIKVKKPRPRDEPVEVEFRGRRRGNSLNSPRTRPIHGDNGPFNPSQSLPQSPLLTPSHSSRRLVTKARVNTITEGEVPADLLSASTSDNESGSDSSSPAHSSNSTIKVLGELGVYCAGMKFQGFDMPDAKNYNHIFSFMESSFARHSRTKDEKMALDLHNMRYLMRVYPDGLRLASSNFDPLIYWRRGVQMVALNWQTNDLGMQLNRAMFEGGTDSSGYVPKPKELREFQIYPTFNLDIAEGKKERSIVAFNIDVLSAQQLMRPANLAANKAMNPYIEIEVFDGRASAGKSSEGRLTNTLSTPLKKQTEVVRENGFNPMFNSGQFQFKVVTKHPEFVFVKFTVKLSPNGESFNHKDQHGVASWTAKVCNLRQGYRTMPLENNEGTQYLFSTLFCKIRVDPIQKTFVEDIRPFPESGKLKSLGGKMFNRMNTSPRSTVEKSSMDKASFDS